MPEVSRLTLPCEIPRKKMGHLVVRLQVAAFLPSPETASKPWWPHQCNNKSGYWAGNTNTQLFFPSDHSKFCNQNPTRPKMLFLDLSLFWNPLIFKTFLLTKSIENIHHKDRFFLQLPVSHELRDPCLSALLSGPPCSSQAHVGFS